MQFALPPRKSPHPLPSARSTRLPYHRRKQLKTVAVAAIAIVTILYLLSYFTSSNSTSAVASSASTSGVVIVTVLDRKVLSESFIKKIVTNREDYAKRHGKLYMVKIIAQSLKFYLFANFVALVLSYRVYELLRKHIRLRRCYWRLTPKLGYTPRRPTRPCPKPKFKILLPPQRACTDNEPDQVTQVTLVRSEQTRITHDEGRTRRPTRQHYQNILSSQGERCRSDCYSGW